MLESSPEKVSLLGGEVTLVPLDQLRARLVATQANAADLRARAQALVAQAQQELSAAGAILASGRTAWPSQGFSDVLLEIDRLAATLAVEDDRLRSLEGASGGIGSLFHKVAAAAQRPSIQRDRDRVSEQLEQAQIQLAGMAWAQTGTAADGIRSKAQDLRGQADGLITQAKEIDNSVALLSDETRRRTEAQSRLGFDSLFTAAYLSVHGPQQVSSPMVLKEGEQAYVVLGANLARYRTRTTYVGGSQGVSIPIGHTGIRYRVGSFHGQPVERTSLTAVDTGQLVLTNRRVAFIGAQKSVLTPLEKIVHVEQYTDGLAFFQEGRESPDYYLVSSPAYFLLYLNWCLDQRN